MSELFVVGHKERADEQRPGGPPPDAGEREKALDVQRSWIVEAPAGSGKTGLLIQRYLKLLADESVDEPEQILAITFTVKAAAEIRERVMAQLEGAGAGEGKSEFDRETRRLAEAVLRRDALYGWKLLEHPRRMNLRTIDSICKDIARSLPVLSGTGGSLAPVTDASALYHEAARQTLMQLGGEDIALNQALRTIMLHRDGSLGDCEKLLAGMLAWRDQWGEFVPRGAQELDDDFLDGTVRPRLERVLEQAICSTLGELVRCVPQDLLEELAALAGEMGHGEGYGGEPSPIAICAGIHAAPGESATHLEHWRALIHLMVKSDGGWRSGFRTNWLRFRLEPAHSRRLQEIVTELHDRNDVLRAINRVNRLPPVSYPEDQWVVAKALFRVLSRAMAELQLVFVARGECDFTELNLEARSALRRGGGRGLETALGAELRHMLVDEMQDTSTSQYELFQLLTEGWDGHGQTVFLVGDPKQSIYRFRQARVERFVRAMQEQRLGEMELGCLRLTANFRSQRGLVDTFNADFPRLFPGEVNSEQREDVPYVKAIAVRDAAGDGLPAVEWHTALVTGASPEEKKVARRRQAKIEAEKIRSIAGEWRARPLPEKRTDPWKIAVLVRSRSHLKEIIAALKRDDGEGSVPFRAVEIEPLGDRQEVLDLFALTRALLHPADRVAWLAVLHAPWCGLGVAELHLLAGGDDPDWAERCIEDVIAERGHLLGEESCERLQRLWPVLRAAGQQRSRLTVAQWVERTWRSLGGDAYLHLEERANALHYLRLLDELEMDGTVDAVALKQRLNKLYAEPSVSRGAVDLMTIHGAKGLEWDVVLVPGLERVARSNTSRLLTWDEIDSEGDEAAARVVLAPIAGKGEPSKELNSWLRSIDSNRETAELKRLFYVACTRAREHLHLFASPEENRDGSQRRPTNSLLRVVWPAAEEHFATASPTRNATILPMPTRPVIEGGGVGDLAAAAMMERRAVIEHLPLEFHPQKRFEQRSPLFYGDAGANGGEAIFERPEASFAARALGNAVHAFLELLAKRLEDGTSPHALVSEVEGWMPRLAAVLRSEGLPPGTVEKMAPMVRMALENSLEDAYGMWLLSGRVDAASEYALTSWEESRRSVRLDRVFRAGATPGAEGSDFLWIVDYKTAVHGPIGIEEFLAGEQKKYGPQMETYAEVMKAKAAGAGIRLGLYYPMLPRLIWWSPQS